MALGIAETEGIEIYNAGHTKYAHHLPVAYRSDQLVLGLILQNILDHILRFTLKWLQGTAAAPLGQD